MMDWCVYMLLPLVIGWLLDRAFGDPEQLPHPIILFGKLIAWAEKKGNKGKNKVAKGVIVAIVFPFAVFVLLSALSFTLYYYCFWCGIAVNTVLVFFGLAGKTLAKEVKAVFEAVKNSEEKGRLQIARIVGRDTSQLNEQQIKTAALETLSENLSDGVIAPLFWYALGGVGGLFAYKMTNTLDSMIGYKSERYKDFGRWSAKIDDVANWIPARLTAFLMLLGVGKLSLLGFVRKYSRNHTSPNAGYPESALAGILNCRFGGGNYYFGKFVDKPYIGENPKKLTFEELQKALIVNLRTEILMVILVSLILIEVFILQ